MAVRQFECKGVGPEARRRQNQAPQHQDFWIQDLAKNKLMEIVPTSGLENLADLGTKTEQRA